MNHPVGFLKGTFENSTGCEAGIAVNEVVAMVHGNRFVLIHLPLQNIYPALDDNLPTLTSQMRNITMINCIDGGDKYHIRQDHDIDGQIVRVTYCVYFIRDENGLWKIEKYG